MRTALAAIAVIVGVAIIKHWRRRDGDSGPLE